MSFHESEGFVFPSMDQVTQLVPAVHYRAPYFSECFNENKLLSNVEIYGFQQCFNVECIISSLKVYSLTISSVQGKTITPSIINVFPQ